LTLTPDNPSKTGGGTLNTPVDLVHNFDLVFEINLGSHAMHNDPAKVAALGGGCGYLGANGRQCHL